MSLARDIKMLLTLQCEESSRLLSDGMERRLGFSERTALRLHLAVCRSCRRFGRNMRMLRGLMHRLHKGPEMPNTDLPPLEAQGRQRILTAVRRARDNDS